MTDGLVVDKRFALTDTIDDGEVQLNITVRDRRRSSKGHA
jgi:hypothetical protein